MEIVLDGWIKVWRKILANPVWTTLPPASLKVFLFCLLSARRVESKVPIENQIVHVPVGSLVTTFRSLASGTFLSLQQVRTAIQKLAATQLITQLATQRYLLINVTNWATYQSTSDECNTTCNTDAQHKVPLEITQLGPQNNTTLVGASLTRARVREKERRREEEEPPTPFAGLPPAEAEVFSLTASNETNGKGKHVAKHPSALELRIAELAGAMSARHPAHRTAREHPVSVLLGKCLRRVKVPERMDLLDLIDKNHQGMCESWDWTKDGGKFCPKLVNWLSTERESYLQPPPEENYAHQDPHSYSLAEVMIRRYEKEQRELEAEES